MTCNALARTAWTRRIMIETDEDVAAGEARIRRALRLSLVIIAGLVVVIGGVVYLTGGEEEAEVVVESEVTGPQIPRSETFATPELLFTDITQAANIDFSHETGAYGDRLLPEAMGGGVAFFDYDLDGDQDLLLVNSTHWPGHNDSSVKPTSKLYRNRGDGSFDDVTHESGLDLDLYGMGVAVGDYDGDGFIDVFISAVGENRLLRNDKGERFVDVTTATGLAGGAQAWSMSAAFFDYDRDGDLDLFVTNYVVWSPQINREVDYQLTGIGRAYGPPTDFAGTDSYLYRNDSNLGQQRFTDVSAEAGIQVANESTGQPVGKALAVHPVDVTGDGWLDLIVANDTVRNFLFVNERNGRFREAGIDAGLAFDTAGLATGAMGVDVANYANDERIAIVIGNFANEMSSFYVARQGESVFSDDAIVAGVGAPSRRALTFGLAFLDVDLDGNLDLLAANGHVEPHINKVQTSQHYAQPAQLFWNCAGTCGRDYRVIDVAGETFGSPLVGRGAAYADIDGDGDLDVIITAVGGKPMLLRNDQQLGHRWLRLQLEDVGVNKHAIGAVVTLDTRGVRQARSVMPARSYLSQVELPVTFGLGDLSSEDAEILITVRWPDGGTEEWTGLTLDTTHTLVRGSGQAIPR